VYRLNEKDENGNFTKGNVVTFDVTNSLIWADNVGVVAVSSVENMVIVKEGDNVLVTKLDKDQTVRELIKIMREKDKYKKYL
jgi:mannose-1-phosphate guanylyltransferase